MSTSATERFVPLSEVWEFAQRVKKMRKAQQRFYRSKKGTAQYQSLLQESIEAEAEVDRICKNINDRYNETPDLFDHANAEGGGN